jgi:hypothetical protein
MFLFPDIPGRISSGSDIPRTTIAVKIECPIQCPIQNLSSLLSIFIHFVIKPAVQLSQLFNSVTCSTRTPTNYSHFCTKYWNFVDFSTLNLDSTHSELYCTCSTSHQRKYSHIHTHTHTHTHTHITTLYPPLLSRFISTKLFSVPQVEMQLKWLQFADVAEIQET